MKISSILILFLLSGSAWCQQKTKNSKSIIAAKKTTTYGQYVPILLGIHNEHDNRDSLKIELVNDYDSISFLHKGSLEGWGMRRTGKKIKTGKYVLILSWYENKKPKKTKREILIKPETEFFSLNIELANEPQLGRQQNAFYLDQHRKSLKTVEFTRMWNPQEQFKKDTILSPAYEVINRNDSTLYGAYLRFSSALSINWIQPHDIAFMDLEQKSGSGWVHVKGCSSPRIAMNLKKGAMGKTYKDMILGCPVNHFAIGQTYRVRIDYMIKNITHEENPPMGEYEDNVYVEQTIYMYTDEFILK